MSHPSASRSALSSSTPTPQQTSRRAQYQARKSQNSAATTPTKNHKHSAPRKRANKADTRGSRRDAAHVPGGKLGRLQSPILTPHRRKVLGAGGAITLLAMATILPTQVSSQAIADANCEQVIQSGAEISRGQISSLLTIPTRSNREAVRQVMAEPYCTLPAIAPEERTGLTTDDSLKTDISQTTELPALIEREAYPLAFDPEAWVVLNYSAGEYQGYDFVFKP